jgi:site-specific recombinase XerD
MAETAPIQSNNLSPNVPAAIEAAKTRLTDLATLYFATEVAGQSQATLDAKRRDLTRFLAFNHQPCGHDRPEECFVSVTKAFLKHLRGERFAQASLVRNYATVRHFARSMPRRRCSCGQAPAPSEACATTPS